MTNEIQTIVTFVLDRSGSMSSVKSKVISGFNEYVEGMKSNDEATVIRLNAFDNKSNDVIYDFEDINHVRRLSGEDYIPGGLTPLYDAIGQSVSATEEFVKGSETESQVIVTIMTDGLENASIEYGIKDVHALISNKEKEGWQFVYLGANQDSWEMGAGMGISHQRVSNYDASNPDSALKTISETTRRMRSSMRENQDVGSIFTAEELEKLNKKKDQWRRSQ
ncbi:MAG TPA: hypothetical protein DCE22_11755 [Verrucomicrobiales bacterium]|nr:hypothetical protein [Verrucomicrobiales bacterium]